MMRASVLLVAALMLGGIGCKPNHPFVWANDVPPSETPVQSVPLRPGDQIVIQVPRMEDTIAPAPMTVNADGTVVLPVVGVVEVEGLTPSAAAQKINARLNGIIVNPDARVSVVNPRLPVVAVLGEVQTPNRYEITHNEGVLQALALAGGVTEFADLDEIYVVRKYPKRLRVRFRYSDLVGGVQRSVDFKLADGDVIVVE